MIDYDFDSAIFQGDHNCPILQAQNDGVRFGKRQRAIRILGCENCPVHTCYVDIQCAADAEKMRVFIKELNRCIQEIAAIKEYVLQKYLGKKSVR